MRSRNERQGEGWTEEWEYEQLQSKRVYSELEHKLSFSKRRVTDMSSCRRLNLPDAGTAQVENILANLKGRILEEGEEYKIEC